VLLDAPNDQHIANVDGDDEEAAYRGRPHPAESVGIELEDDGKSQSENPLAVVTHQSTRSAIWTPEPQRIVGV